MRSFVATITDRTTGFTLASSPPTACHAPAGFQFVTHGHEYTAEVDGYELPADELNPVGGRHTGSRTLLDSDGQVAQPRWATSCGEGVGLAAVARFNTVVSVGGCDPMGDDAPSSAAALSIDVRAAVGELGCDGDSDDGLVDVVEVSSPGLPTVLTACDGPPIVYSAGIEPGRVYEISLVARGPEDTSGGPWGASCHAVAEAGLEVSARCDALSESGAIDVAIDSLLETQDITCGDDVSSFSITLENGEVTVDSGQVDCAETVRLGPLPAGDYGGTLNATDADGELVFSAVCGASIEPAQVTAALCTITPNP